MCSAMRYEDFLDLWNQCLDESDLRIFGLPRQTLDLGSMDRTYEVFVEPARRHDAEPFTITARFKWRWDALQSARTATCESDMMTELLGREDAEDIDTELPWMRLDVVLAATLEWGKAQPLPHRSRGGNG
jgi:hypothetical protein